MNKKTQSESHQINTEKLYLFRRVCEEAAKRQYGISNFFKRKLCWPELQAALRLIEIYEEYSVDQLKKSLKDLDNELSSKIYTFNKSKWWAPPMPEERMYGITNLFKRKKNKHLPTLSK